MGDHDAPSSWLERWRESEPVRLYLWGVASSVVAASLVAGWLTAELAVAVTGVAAAVLMLPATAWARRETYSPRTVDQLLAQTVPEARVDGLLEEQHALSYRQGVEAATQALAQVQRTPDVVAAETRELAAVAAAETERAWPREQLPPCPYVSDDGRRCVLPWHPATFPHRLDEEGVGE